MTDYDTVAKIQRKHKLSRAPECHFWHMNLNDTQASLLFITYVSVQSMMGTVQSQSMDAKTVHTYRMDMQILIQA